MTARRRDWPRSLQLHAMCACHGERHWILLFFHLKARTWPAWITGPLDHRTLGSPDPWITGPSCPALRNPVSAQCACGCDWLNEYGYFGWPRRNSHTTSVGRHHVVPTPLLRCTKPDYWMKQCTVQNQDQGLQLSDSQVNDCLVDGWRISMKETTAQDITNYSC